MADKTFTEAEHIAILSSRVEQETAKLAGDLEAAQADKAKVESEAAAQLEVKDAEIAALKAELEGLKAELAGIKEEQAAAELAAKRVEAAKKANPNLDASYFTPERAARYGKLSEDAFEIVLESLGNRVETSPEDSAREIAAAGAQVGGGGGAKPTPRAFLGGI